MKTYTLYVNEYGTALALLKEMNQSPEFVALMKQLAEDVRNTPLDPGKQTMKDFLIMPVQRIPRYTMLLQVRDDAAEERGRVVVVQCGG